MDDMKKRFPFMNGCKVTRKKLRQQVGETMPETLMALLVITLAMTMLAGSIVSAAKINHSTETMNTAFNADSSNLEVISTGTTAVISHSAIITVDPSGAGETVADTVIDIEIMQTKDNGYQFYSKN